MGTRYAALPLNQKAVSSANAAVFAEMDRAGEPRRQLTMDNHDAAYRKVWLDAYFKAGGGVLDCNPSKKVGSATSDCSAEPPGFATIDDAARAALQQANPDSIRDNLEYSGLIYEKDGKYYYTGPAPGTDTGADPLTDAPAPAGTTIVGDYHTHGDYSTADTATGAAVRTTDPSKDQFNSDNFSTADKQDSNNNKYPGYLGTPSGTSRKYDPATGSDTTI